MSRNEQSTEKKDVFYKTRHFKRIFDSAKKITNNNTLSGILVFMIVISGICELIGNSPGFIWYGFTLIVLSIISYKELKQPIIINERENGNNKS